MAGATQWMVRKSFTFNFDLRLLLIFLKILHSIGLAGAQSVPLFKLEPQVLVSNGGLVSSEVASKQSELVVCVWTRVSYFRRPSVALSVGSRISSIGDVSIGMVPKGLILRQGSSARVTAATITPLTWYHLCINLTPTRVSVFFDGKRLLKVNTLTDYLKGNIYIILGGGLKWPEVPPSTVSLTAPTDESMSVLRSQSDYNQIVGSFAGDLANPMVFNEFLSDRDIEMLAQCQDVMVSTMRDVPSWQTTGGSVTRGSTSPTEPCRKRQFDYVLFPEPMQYVDNVELCIRLGMELLQPQTRDLQSLHNDAIKYKDSCGNGDRTVWLATEDDSCFSLANMQKQVAPCTTRLCRGCQFKGELKQLFTLRGLCPLPDMDLAFVPAMNFGSSPYFQGTERYNIQKNGNLWELRDTTTSIVIATTKGNDPVGTRIWTLAAESCGNDVEKEIEATLSVCDWKETSCRGGECIPLENRCDSYPHCTDGFDEEQCQPIRTPKGYLRNAPPPNPPVDISLRIEVTRVVSTEPLLLLLNTHLSWEDPRLRFSNLPIGKDHPLPLSTAMWQPRLMVMAQRSTAPADMVLQVTNESIYGKRESSASLVARTVSAPMYDMRDSPMFDTIYPGANTTITLSEYVLRPIDCYYDVSFYPFDVHDCELSLVLVPQRAEHARLVIPSNAARYTGRTRLSDFNFDEVKMKKENAKIGGRDHSGVVLTVRLSRRSSYIVVSVILPSLLLLCISTASLWMTYPTKSPTRLIVNCCVTGAFLGLWMIATFSSPVTGKVKALDVWLCFCTMHSILHALLHVFLDIFGTDEPQPLFSRVMSRAPSRMREVKPVESGSIYDNLMRVTENEETWTVAYWITFIARVVSPALVVLFNASFWPFVVYFSRNPLP